MYKISKRFEISASHQLKLSHVSPCTHVHGHNWIITIFCKAETLNENGMVEDFAEVKRKIHGTLDHTHLNDVLPFNPTSENIARWIYEQIPTCYRVEIKESEGNTAIYEED